ncbi:MAG: ATP-dependent DNA helicase RecG [Planctomycetota bacterium]|nr:MAG: ATP-dependent DNA helicase RecG [Planctomycetota bacterium]
MSPDDLHALISTGEDSRLQFKADIRSTDSLASEMAAMANGAGGRILLGVADDGSTPGLESADVQRLNQLISNAASQHVRSPLTVHTENVAVDSGRVVIVLTIPEGLDKPYFDRQGVIWLKSGADKRRVQSKEELRRLFQISAQFHADELPTKAGMDAIDRSRLRAHLDKRFKQELPEDPAECLTLVQNLNLATDRGQLNLAGVLYFAKNPQRWQPTCLVKAVSYPGTAIDGERYLDSEDFSGTLVEQCDGALAFIMRCLPKVQNDQGINTLGQPTIPRIVFEELVVNALIHRDYLISSTIRIFVFSDRIEITSPGHLPNHLTVAKIRSGTSITRNPILVSLAAQGLLPYRGLGTGIRRAIDDWPAITFSDDRDGNQFTATIYRHIDGTSVEKTVSTDSEPISTEPDTVSTELGPDDGSVETEAAILALLRSDNRLTAKALAERLEPGQRAIEKQLAKLQRQGRLRRIGPRKGGHWQVIDDPERDATP